MEPPQRQRGLSVSRWREPGEGLGEGRRPRHGKGCGWKARSLDHTIDAISEANRIRRIYANGRIVKVPSLDDFPLSQELHDKPSVQREEWTADRQWNHGISIDFAHMYLLMLVAESGQYDVIVLSTR